jgi:response regulator RpfG family c-di-GMP phosphodiesterase
MSGEKIMVVDDEWVVTDQLCRNLKDLGYTVCSTASTADEAIRAVEADRPDLILMDIVLKGKMDGIEAADRINSQFNIPVIYLTAYTNQEYIERAKQTNPFGYLVKPHNQKELYATIEMAFHKNRVDKKIKDYLDRLTRCYRGTIKAFSGAIESRGPYACGHHQRVAEFTHAISKEMGLADSSIEGACFAAYVYDIGLVSMPVSMQHREFFDGSGFPRGIKGENILIEARILAVAVAIEDLTSHRAFRNAFPLQQALDEVSAHRGSQYDPDVVDACLRLFYEKGYKMKG